MIGAGPAGAGLLYDSRRGVYYAKPLLRGWLPHVGAAAVCQYAAIARFAGLARATTRVAKAPQFHTGAAE